MNKRVMKNDKEKEVKMKKLIPILLTVVLIGLLLTGCPPPEEPSKGCFIATATYGTPTAEEINVLRQFRDDFLRESSLGNNFVNFYYRSSPPFAAFIARHEVLKTIVREGLVDPVVILVDRTRGWWQN